MTWEPKLAISLSPAPNIDGTSVFDLTGATGHVPGGLDLVLPSGGDWVRYNGNGAYLRKYSGLSQIQTINFNDSGGAIPTEGINDWLHFTYSDMAGGNSPSGLTGSDNHCNEFTPPSDTSVNWGKRFTFPASRALGKVYVVCANFAGDYRVRASLSDNSAVCPTFKLPKIPSVNYYNPGVDASFVIDFCASDSNQLLSWDVYCASRTNDNEDMKFAAVWVPPPTKPPRPRGFGALQVLTGVMGTGRGNL